MALTHVMASINKTLRERPFFISQLNCNLTKQRITLIIVGQENKEMINIFVMFWVGAQEIFCINDCLKQF